MNKSNGAIYKIPLDNPNGFTPVAADKKILGADGIILINNQTLAVIANQIPGHQTNAAFLLSTSDSWKNAQVMNQHNFGNVYPTTGVLKDNKIFVMHSRLNTLVSAPPEQRAALQQNATIEQIEL